MRRSTDIIARNQAAACMPAFLGAKLILPRIKFGKSLEARAIQCQPEG